MSLPSRWIDEIFSRLLTMYGSRFRDMYADVDPDALRAHWAESLGGFRDQPERIGAALKACESRSDQRPPTLPEFIGLCRAAAAAAHRRALSAPPPSEAERARAAATVEKLSVEIIKPPATDPKAWARSILDRAARGDKTLNSAQIEFARRAVRHHATPEATE